MAPVLISKLFNFLNIPIDFGKKINGKPIFGKNKTIRGLLFGVIFGVIICFIQYLLYSSAFFKSLSTIDYSMWLILGILMGLGALIGDLAESFIKRRLKIKPGGRFIPWDQLDFVIGAIIFTYPLINYTLLNIIIILIASFILHITFTRIGYLLKLRKEKW